MTANHLISVCRQASGLEFFQKTSIPKDSADKLIDLEKEKGKHQKIRCPHCQWQPRKSSLWSCADCAYPEFFFAGCHTAWNTFDTRGQCPGCQHQWRYTSCLRCAEWSRHEDWYENAENLS